ncbi:MAG: LruC domain-containing protein [Bacteroidaceae bacterium]|nr:LruC domain-containing protein [Bacteroidaceae bacterium]
MLLVGCQDYNYVGEITAGDEDILNNAQLKLGIKVNTEQDWSTTNNGTITITADADLEDITKVQILTCSPFGGANANGATVLNEVDAQKGQSVTLTYDAPVSLTRLYAACVSEEGKYYIKGFDIGQKTVSFEEDLETRASYPHTVSELPQSIILERTEKSYNNQRNCAGWNNDVLYQLADNKEDGMVMVVPNYSKDYIRDLRDILFSYLPNKISNIEKIKESKYYNDNCYAITTGTEPIIVEPIYIWDGGTREASEAHLYYYYFKDSDIVGMSDSEQVQFFKNLPKYKAIQMYRSYRNKYASTGMAQDSIKKETAYALMYWGEGKPTLKQTLGSYQFPRGYKIGFMLRVNVKNGNTAQDKTGELYCDGRLNADVNNYGAFASSKLGATDSRMAWIAANNKNYLCCETGTDRDFNDAVFEIEGGIESFDEQGNMYGQVYTFCFEDRELGDYDLNDVVIKAVRIDKDHVVYSLEACGGEDPVYLRNINGKVLNGNKEIHEILNVSKGANASGDQHVDPVVETITVDPSFTFKDLSKQVYIYNAATNKDVRLSEKGEDPHAILVPSDFQYPLEGVCIKDAYPAFLYWASDRTQYTDWYLRPEIETNVYTYSAFQYTK